MNAVSGAAFHPCLVLPLDIVTVCKGVHEHIDSYKPVFDAAQAMSYPMNDKTVGPDFESLERQYGIPPDKYCGLTPEGMSRAIVAYHSGPRRQDQLVGYNPVGSLETRLSWLRSEFGPEADVEKIRLQEQFFSGRVNRVLNTDWMLPNQEFDRAVGKGLRVHFPELTEEARQVIAGNYSYSHAK